MNRIKTTASFVVLAAMSLGPVALDSQQQTERYIPIGQSPGVSGILSAIGEVEAVDATALSLTVRSGGTSITIQLTSETRIWIDRSGNRLTNLVGTYEDCEVGRTIEVRFLDPERRERADWVKVSAGPG